jgi:3-oxoacyl-[acyl-carrier protein] reductase
VNVTSINAFSPEGGLAAYDASKAALAQLTKTAALELGPLNIRVNAVAPGLIAAPDLETEAPERVNAFLAHAPLGRLVDPEDIANAACFLASAESSAITGQTLVVDCGVSLSGYMATN